QEERQFGHRPELVADTRSQRLADAPFVGTDGIHDLRAPLEGKDAQVYLRISQIGTHPHRRHRHHDAPHEVCRLFGDNVTDVLLYLSGYLALSRRFHVGFPLFRLLCSRRQRQRPPYCSYPFRKRYLPHSFGAERLFPYLLRPFRTNHHSLPTVPQAFRTGHPPHPFLRRHPRPVSPLLRSSPLPSAASPVWPPAWR